MEHGPDHFSGFNVVERFEFAAWIRKAGGCLQNLLPQQGTGRGLYIVCSFVRCITYHAHRRSRQQPASVTSMSSIPPRLFSFNKIILLIITNFASHPYILEVAEYVFCELWLDRQRLAISALTAPGIQLGTKVTSVTSRQNRPLLAATVFWRCYASLSGKAVLVLPACVCGFAFIQPR